MAIHPLQVEIANEVFSPSAEQVAWAREVLEAFDLNFSHHAWWRASKGGGRCPSVGTEFCVAFCRIQQTV